ncbi:integrase core domain protein [Paraburkholderia fungorum]|uniref:Integrase core domain protein n=1 Tax=Paraburkholderia fungorum TaxID=134537 RepID=A0AAU8T1I2_9BURK|nr:Mu transposase C-terminal domain-containing protein [Paraburkholderia fungorum]AJZ57684.1 integrase core domain protein [Paraburkholderia fungorum]
MSGFAFRTGLVFEWRGVPHQIERLAIDDQILLKRLNDGQPILSTRNQLLTDYLDGEVAAKSDVVGAPAATLPGRPLQDLPLHVRSELQRRVAYIHAIEDAGTVVFTPHCLEPLIHAVASRTNDAKPPSVTTLYRWYARYRTHRQMRALIPRYDRRGGSGVRQTDRILELVEEATKEALGASPAATGTTIYALLVGKIKSENSRRLPDDQLVTPSIRTFYRLFGRMQAYDLYVLKHGKAAADRRFQIVKAGPKVSRILERVEADHTPLDLFLVDEETALPLGRPILTLLIDVYSRFPVGYFLSFGGTSTAVVMGALRHAVLPKPQTNEVIPNLPVHHQWPCYGRMHALILDNGLEFHADDLESVAFDLDIRLQFCPKHQPRFKGVVERFLKTVNYFFAHQLPGTSLAKMADRGDYDPVKHALLTLAEFKHLFEKWLLDVYAQKIHRGIHTTPWAKWHEGLSTYTPELPESVSDLQRRIGLVEERRLGREGITLNDLKYAGGELSPLLNQWGPGVKVRIVYDPEDLGQIQVWAPESEDPVTVFAVKQAYATGLTLHQHELICQRVREKGESTEDSEALAEAKYEIALAIDALLKSRKQRSRRVAAKLHGMTSAKPKARLTPSPATAKRAVEKPQSDPVAMPEIQVVTYPTFTLPLSRNPNEYL